MPTHALVADDGPSARAATATLTADGFDVTTIDHGGLAVTLLARGVPAFAVAVLDCEMPGLDGAVLLARVRAAGCRVPLLLVSWTANPVGVARLADDPLAAFLAKPFTPDALSRGVAALIAAAGGTP